MSEIRVGGVEDVAQRPRAWAPKSLAPITWAYPARPGHQALGQEALEFQEELWGCNPSPRDLNRARPQGAQCPWSWRLLSQGLRPRGELDRALARVAVKKGGHLISRRRAPIFAVES